MLSEIAVVVPATAAIALLLIPLALFLFSDILFLVRSSFSREVQLTREQQHTSASDVSAVSARADVPGMPVCTDGHFN